MGHFGTTGRSKMSEKHLFFQKKTHGPFGVPNRMNEAHFWPILIGSNQLSRVAPSYFLALHFFMFANGFGRSVIPSMFAQ